jgi:2-dehydro-3-deoxyphosphogluconate aldolase/(4S)-4-hydroxy-2-oxoglutarate aldolase
MQTIKTHTLERIKKLGLVAVIRGPSAELTLKMVEALVAGGVYGIEITYSTPNATQVVRTLAEKFGDQILLGMGTLKDPAQVREAREAGANYLVSPHCDDELAQAMTSSGLAVMIGALTPSEIVQAHRLGSDVVKLFPGSFTGPGYLKALREPFPEIPIMPTGGVDAQNVADWFAAGAFAVGAGGALCPKAWGLEGRFTDITTRAKEFVKAVEQARQAIKS